MSVIIDNFNRANGELGAAWDSGYTSANALQIVSNKVQAAAANSADSIESNNSLSFVDGFAEAQMSISGASNADSLGVLLRAVAAPTLTFYFFFMSGGAGGGTQIAKKVAGAFTTIASDTTTWADGDKIRGEINGSTLKLRRNGTVILSGTDSSITAPGLSGLLINIGTGRALTELQADNFIAGFSGPALINLLGVGVGQA